MSTVDQEVDILREVVAAMAMEHLIKSSKSFMCKAEVAVTITAAAVLVVAIHQLQSKLSRFLNFLIS